jgi:IS30 family transposase
MKKKYYHLSAEERALIMIEHRRGASQRRIAEELGRNVSTVSRELLRNHAVCGAPYEARHAAVAYKERRQRSVRRRKLTADGALYQYVHDRLVFWRWSPEQIAAKLRRMHPADPTLYVSRETIYAAIYAYPRGSLKQAMIEALRQSKPSRGLARTTIAKTGFVLEELGIVHRPEEVAERLLPGHWEGDLIKGAFNRSAVGTVVERKTRFVVLCRMAGCTAQDALEGFSRQMTKVPAFLRERLTYDRGSEMACHAQLAKRLNLHIWFADPHAPWQRGSNENTNGLLRQFLPKGMDLSAVSQTQLNDIARLLNARPRKTLGWEALAKEIASFYNRVALDS